MAIVSGNPMDAGSSCSSQPDTAYPTDGSLESIRLLGTPVACATYDSALERIKALAREPRATAVCPSNTHILGEARHNPEFARVLARFDLVLPDGMPVVWSLNFRGAGLKDRVYGPYFMRHALRNTPRPWRLFFGDSEECLVELRRVLVQLQPDIEIVGMLSPPFRPFTEADEVSFADTINRADPDFVWVALPGVRMERWIIDNQARYRSGVFLAVGDAFTLLSGRRSFAPPWMQRMGLTWAYRVCKEPLRLGPRYLRYNLCSYLICYGTSYASGLGKRSGATPGQALLATHNHGPPCAGHFGLRAGR
jgi:N-acetylglucosaminyldiphosphoundecaprenol N-acetyl-beta-D-mannosaminyltransferase